MVWKYSSVLLRTLKAMLIQSRIAGSETRNKRTGMSSVPATKRSYRWIGHSFKVIQGHPYWCRQESRTVCCRNVQLMPMLFLKLTKIWQRENAKFVDFNDSTQVWRRPSKKRLRISTNDLYCQKPELSTCIFAADGSTFISFYVITFQIRTLWIQNC